MRVSAYPFAGQKGTGSTVEYWERSHPRVAAEVKGCELVMFFDLCGASEGK